MIERNKSQQLPKSALSYWMTKSALILLTLWFVRSGLSASSADFENATIGFLLLGSIVGIYQILYYHSFQILLEDDKLIITSGILTKHSKVIPLNQVQNVSLTSGILARMFGLTKIDVWLALTAQVVISTQTGRPLGKPGLRLDLKDEDAHWLMDALLKRK